MVCPLDNEAGPDACDDHNCADEHYYVAGIISFGSPVCGDNSVTIITDIIRSINWIHTIIDPAGGMKNYDIHYYDKLHYDDKRRYDYYDYDDKHKSDYYNKLHYDSRPYKPHGSRYDGPQDSYGERPHYKYTHNSYDRYDKTPYHDYYDRPYNRYDRRPYGHDRPSYHDGPHYKPRYDEYDSHDKKYEDSHDKKYEDSYHDETKTYDSKNDLHYDSKPKQKLEKHYGARSGETSNAEAKNTTKPIDVEVITNTI